MESLFVFGFFLSVRFDSQFSFLLQIYHCATTVKFLIKRLMHMLTAEFTQAIAVTPNSGFVHV